MRAWFLSDPRFKIPYSSFILYNDELTDHQITMSLLEIHFGLLLQDLFLLVGKKDGISTAFASVFRDAKGELCLFDPTTKSVCPLSIENLDYYFFSVDTVIQFTYESINPDNENVLISYLNENELSCEIPLDPVPARDQLSAIRNSEISQVLNRRRFKYDISDPDSKVREDIFVSWKGLDYRYCCWVPVVVSPQDTQDFLLDYYSAEEQRLKDYNKFY